VQLLDVTVSTPTLHGRDATVGELRSFFGDDHVHLALLVDGRRLVTAVERRDLDASLPDDLPAHDVGRLAGRIVGAGAAVDATLRRMQQQGRRRLAVVDAEGDLVGLLCLKASGDGFCTDDGIALRRLASSAAGA
jgi:CBS domain-containing protein